MKNKHTPGPWTIDTPLEHQVCITAKSHHSGAEPIVCRIFDSSHVELAQQEANARLIAAAPCLLDICERLNAYNALMVSAVDRAALRSAIAKATGETI